MLYSVAMGTALVLAALAAVSGPAVAQTQSSPEAAARASELKSLEEVRAQQHGPLTERVLEFLSIMDRTVNRDKQSPITKEDWAPLGELVDRSRFHRVGNYGEEVNWDQYSDLLTRWANSSWWKGYIWRLHEVPAADGKPGLVYMETEERSNQSHPVRDDGDYSTLDSIAVYEFNDEGKITALHVYDQRPL